MVPRFEIYLFIFYFVLIAFITSSVIKDYFEISVDHF